LLDRLALAPPAVVAALTAVLIAAVAVADWFSGAEVAASLAYLLPISLAAWAGGRAAAACVAVAAAGAWLLVDVHTHWSELVTAIEVVNLAVLLLAFTGVGQLLACLRERLDLEHRLAHTDSLTAIHNRRALWSAAGRELERCHRSGQPFSLAYLDVDGFKHVNDQFGHAAGDELLRQIARTIQSGLRQLDMVARLGGDEFAILLPGTDEAGARAAVSRLRDRLQAAPRLQAREVDFSLGCLTVLSPPEQVDTIVERADELMYAMKRSGRGQVRHEVLGPDDGGRPVLIPRPDLRGLTARTAGRDPILLPRPAPGSPRIRLSGARPAASRPEPSETGPG
jgi:diguanylate cyclase (GGDEF)-like protein